MGQFYDSFQDLLFAESEASEAYKRRKYLEKRKEQKQSDARDERRLNARIKDDTESLFSGKPLKRDMLGQSPTYRRERERREKQMWASTDNTDGSTFKKDIQNYKNVLSARNRNAAEDAIDRHSRRHPTKEGADYGIFTSLLCEEQVDDAELGLQDTELGMGDRDFGDDMAADVGDPEELGTGDTDMGDDMTPENYMGESSMIKAFLNGDY